MPKIRFEIVTAERVVYSEDVDVVVAPDMALRSSHCLSASASGRYVEIR